MGTDAYVGVGVVGAVGAASDGAKAAGVGTASGVTAGVGVSGVTAGVGVTGVGVHRVGDRSRVDGRAARASA